MRRQRLGKSHAKPRQHQGWCIITLVARMSCSLRCCKRLVGVSTKEWNALSSRYLPISLSKRFLTQLYERVELEPEVYRLRYELFSLGLHNPLIEPKVRERLAQRRDEIGSVIAKVLENSERTEGAQRSSLDPTLLAALLLSIFDGLALQKIMDPTFDLEAAYHLLAQMLHALAL